MDKNEIDVEINPMNLLNQSDCHYSENDNDNQIDLINNEIDDEEKVIDITQFYSQSNFFNNIK